jgi:hypothetical protein
LNYTKIEGKFLLGVRGQRKVQYHWYGCVNLQDEKYEAENRISTILQEFSLLILKHRGINDN